MTNNINNLNPSSAADLSSSQLVAPRGKAARARSNGPRGFTSRLADAERKLSGDAERELSKKGGMVAAQSLAGGHVARPDLKATPHLDAAHLDAAGRDPLLQRDEQANLIAHAMTEAGSPMISMVPMTAKGVSSADTGSQYAGLKPWDQNWVFEGKPRPTPDIHPVFGKSDREIEIAGAKKALAQLAAAANALAAERAQVGSQARAIPAAAQVSQGNERTRGGMGVQTSNAALLAALAGMKGNMEDVRVNGAPSSRYRLKEAGGGLSGAEFMKTLSMVRPHVGANTSATNPALQPGSVEQAVPKLQLVGQQPGSALQGAGEGLHQGKVAPDFSAALSVAGLHGLAGQHGLAAQHGGHVVQLAGNVVPGEMARNQLTHAAILNMSNGIHSISAQGGGEMRIRLHPDNLGELRLRVSTRGNEVGLQIQASNEKAKKVLEDSLSSLKDSLASKSLTLGTVAIDVGHVAPTQGSPMSADAGNSGQNQQGQFSNAWGQAMGDGGRNPRYGNSDSLSGSISGSGRGGMRALRSSANQLARTSDGRIDVMA